MKFSPFTANSATEPTEPLAAAKFIKEIGRGKDGARSMSQADAAMLYTAMLAGRVSDLELGGILLSMRIKGESIEEIAGFLQAAQPYILPLQTPADSEYAPVVIPTYNGARKKANLTPLLALLLARRGVPVLVHGVRTDAGRVATAEIFQALDLPLLSTADQVLEQMQQKQPAFMPIESLSPAMAHLLSLRRILGVRNSTHTLVKLLQPFTMPALRLSSYTHPEYLLMLQDYFSRCAPAEAGDVFLMRGTEGETVASTGRAQQIDWFHAGQGTTLVPAQQEPLAEVPVVPDSIDAATTAAWIRSVLAGNIAVPENIAAQVEHCASVARSLRQQG
ncbi:DNA-binding protein YbiB [Undibacterium pigrum]|uniref:DNA-binding protein YbiB n=1 Tax=Undibacterium pigrum TaxID=401470 RepID=UPI001FE979B9|nr:DNA-binding protein YbiB [Undibacterium pigrum]